jgi:sialic acid synthase SpsE
MSNVSSRDHFDNLFVLELANNHNGSLLRGTEIISTFSTLIHRHQVRAAIKLQFRDVDTFIHSSYKHRRDLRYIRRTLETRLEKSEFREMVDLIRATGCIPMATPFDERSVDFAVQVGCDVLKLASSDIGDLVLIQAMLETKKPLVASTAGGTETEIDQLVDLYKSGGVPLALNHCVSIYPSKAGDMQLNNIDYLINRYPELVIGLSSHEDDDFTTSIVAAYAKGARTFERHIDIERSGYMMSPYCMSPEQCEQWFLAFKRVKQMSGPPPLSLRRAVPKELAYLDSLCRGYYASRDIRCGERITKNDIYLAIPLHKSQLSARERVYGLQTRVAVKKDDPIKGHMFDEAVVSSDEQSRMAERGL